MAGEDLLESGIYLIRPRADPPNSHIDVQGQPLDARRQIAVFPLSRTFVNQMQFLLLPKPLGCLRALKMNISVLLINFGKLPVIRNPTGRGRGGGVRPANIEEQNEKSDKTNRLDGSASGRRRSMTRCWSPSAGGVCTTCCGRPGWPRCSRPTRSRSATPPAVGT